MRNGMAWLLRGTALGLLTAGPVWAQDASVMLDPVVIDAEADNAPIARSAASASKTRTPLTETPQAVNVVTRAEIENRGARTIAQALRYTPGIHPEPNGADIRYDWLYIRGSNTYGTIWLDGLILPGDPNNYATPTINPYALDRIEVVKGPASVLYGRSIPGGLVNLVSKRPERQASHEVVLGFSSFGGAQAGFDTTGPLSDTLSYRLVGQVRNNHTQIDRERDRQIMLAPSLTWQVTPDTVLTAFAYYQKDNPDNFNPRFYPATGTLIDNPAGNIPRDLYMGDPSLNEFNRTTRAIGYEFSHRFNDDWSVGQTLRYAKSEQDMLLVLVNPAFAFDAPGTVLNRASAISDDYVTSFNADTRLEGRVVSGAVEHRLLFGVDYLRADSSTNFGNGVAGVPPLDYLDPVYGTVDIPAPAVTRSALQEQTQTGIYAQDQMRWGKWIGTLGVRHDWSRIETHNRISDERYTNKEDQTSYRAGLIYLAENGLAPYVSYSTGFLPLLGVDAFGNPFKAQETRQFELGVKYAPADGRGMISVSVYDMKIKNALTPYDAYSSVQTGEQRVKGAEIEAKYEITPQFSLAASYAYTDGKVTKSNNPVEQGREIQTLPRHQATLWADYRPGQVPGLQLSGGIRAMSDYQTDNSYNPDLRIPGRGLVDVAASYELGGLGPQWDGAAVQLAVTNLFDKEYVSHCRNATGGSCNYGTAREATLNLSYRW